MRACSTVVSSPAARPGHHTSIQPAKRPGRIDTTNPLTANMRAGCGKRRWSWPSGRDSICLADWRRGVGDAGRGSADGRSVQLRELREPGAGWASAAGRFCRWPMPRWPALIGRVPAALRVERTALDRAGEAAARPAAAGVLLGPLRAADRSEDANRGRFQAVAGVDVPAHIIQACAPYFSRKDRVKPLLVTLAIALASHEMLVVTPIIVQVAHDVVEVVDNRLVAAVARIAGAEVAAAGCRTWSVSLELLAAALTFRGAVRGQARARLPPGPTRHRQAGGLRPQP